MVNIDFGSLMPGVLRQEHTCYFVCVDYSVFIWGHFKCAVDALFIIVVYLSVHCLNKFSNFIKSINVSDFQLKIAVK